MPTPPTIERLRSMVLSAVSLKELQPNWSDVVIEEWLNLLENIITIAELIDVEIDQKIEEIATDFSDGSILYAEGNKLTADISKLFWNISENILKITGTIQSQGRIKGDVVVTPVMSPYEISITDETIFANTTGGDIVLNLPAGLDGDALRIMNIGVSGNDVTINPNGAELLYSVNGSESLYDLEHLDLQYEITLGWN